MGCQAVSEGSRLNDLVIIRQGQLHRHSRGDGTVDGAHNLAAFIPGDGWDPLTLCCLNWILDLRAVVFGAHAHGLL